MEATIRLDYNRRDCFCVWRSSRSQTGGNYRVLGLTTDAEVKCYVVANRFQHASDNEILLGSVFAAKQGLKEKEVVFVESEGALDSFSSTASISVVPDSSEDWEILEANQDLLIHSFLSQCCCVWPGMRLPLWVNNLCISLIVEHSDHDSKFFVIKEFTEVSVGTPKPVTRTDHETKVIPSDLNFNDSSLEPKPFPDDVPNDQKSNALLVKDKRSVVSFFVSILDFVYFLWRGHTYSCRRQMDLLSAKWKERFQVTSPPRISIHRLNVDLRIPISWPVVYTSEDAPYIGLLRILPNRSAARLSKQQKDVEDGQASLPVIVSVLPSNDCEPGQLLTNERCRRMLGASVSDCIAITPLQYETAHLRVLELVTERPLSAESQKVLRRVFHKWLGEHFSDENPLVLCRELVVQLVIDEEDSVECRFDLKFHYSLQRDNTPHFALLSPRMVTNGFVRTSVRVRGVNEETATHAAKPFLDPPTDSDQLPEIMLEETLLRSCKECLLEKEYVGAVVCGPASSGRTVLLRQVVSSLQDDRQLQTHCVWISCREWRGKAFDKFRRHSHAAFTEAIWRWPSIVVLDDIDALIASSGFTEQEDDTKERVYASYFRFLFDQIFLPPDGTSRHGMMGSSHQPQVVLLVSVESGDCLNLINEFTLRSNGTPLFNVWVEMPTMNEDILERVLLPQFVPDHETFNLANFISSLGKNVSTFGVGDLKFLLEKEVYSPSDQRDSDRKLRDFSAVGGLYSAKLVLTRSVIWSRRYPEIFRQCPLRPQRGVLLFGPTGCGKTLLGRSLADEAGIDLIQVQGPELLSKYIGASEANVRDVFSRAVRSSPCILLFDDFDALAPRRGHDSTGVTDRVVNQLLTELDGAESQLDGVFVVAASNRPDMIDPALLRPGRLDLHVYCPLPNSEERSEILQLCEGELTLSFENEASKTHVLERTEGYTGADLRSLFLAARLAGLRRRGLWNVRELWSGDDVEVEKRNTGTELQDEVQMAIELNVNDFDDALRQVSGTFGQGRSQQRAIMENAFLNFHRKHNPDLATETQLRVTLA